MLETTFPPRHHSSAPEVLTQRFAKTENQEHLTGSQHSFVFRSPYYEQTEQSLPSPCQSGQFLTADLAFNYATLKQAEFINALTLYGWEGSYSLQGNYNALHFRKGFLQEIYVVLDAKMDAAVAKEVAATLHPFPVSIHSPEGCYASQLPTDETIWNLCAQSGMYAPNVNSRAPPRTMTAPADGSGLSGKESGANPALNSHGGTIKHSRNTENQTERGKFPDRKGDGDASDRGSGGVGGNASDTSIAGLERSNPRQLHLLFRSTLSLTMPKQTQPTIFNTHGSVHIKVLTITLKM